MHEKIENEQRRHDYQEINESCPWSAASYELFIDQPRAQIQRPDMSRVTPHQRPCSQRNLLAVHAATTQRNATDFSSQKRVQGEEWNMNGISTEMGPSDKSKTSRNYLIGVYESGMTKSYHISTTWNIHGDNALLSLWMVKSATKLNYVCTSCPSFAEYRKREPRV